MTKVICFLATALLIGMAFATQSRAQGPGLTTASDTVYRADGSPASGTVLISWPSFQTAAGDAVAAGNLSVSIGPRGAFTAQLVPNVGASPAGTYYSVVLQLEDGTVRTEYWAVPATSPITIAAILTTPGNGLSNLAATQQYVNAELATRAIDSTVVHLAGTETITGVKQFTVPPALPSPELSGQSILNISDASWLEIQHLRIDWYDAYGVQIQRASDHLWLANMTADSEVENGAVPLGFYVHPSWDAGRYSSL